MLAARPGGSRMSLLLSDATAAQKAAPRLTRPALWAGSGIVALILFLRLATLSFYPLIDPTESRYSEMGRKMLETGNWLMPQFDYGVPFWGKPPLGVWLTAASLAVGGVNEF